MESTAIVSGSSLLQYSRFPRHRSVFIFGLAVALIIHLGLAIYLITQTIATPAPVAFAPERPIDGGIVSLVPLTPDPKPPINVHKPQNPQPVADPLAATPPETPAATTSTHPPESLPQSTSAVEGPAQTGAGASAVAAAPKWSRFPGPESLSAYYPPRALDAEIEGTATLQCTVLDDKGRVGCKVMSEKPGGYGFGDATRKMVERIGRVEVGLGANPVGTVLNLTVTWHLPA